MEMKRKVQNTLEDVRDIAQESMHRTAADAEHSHRELVGDEMTPLEKVTSVASEVSHRTQAEIDRAKRHLRGTT